MMPRTRKRATMKLAAAMAVGVIVAGCTVGPNYHKPATDVPVTYRNATPEESAAGTAPSFGEMKWWDVFKDDQLQQLIRTALKNNYDIRIAATRVLQAQAQLGITRSDQYPQVNGGAQITSTRYPKTTISPPYQINAGQLTLSASWELDFWGKYRRATEAARANLLASEWNQRGVLNTVISNVATAYFNLRNLDYQLEISKQTLASRQDSLKLTQALEQGGNVSLVDVRQSEQLVYTASEEIPALEKQIAQTEDLLSILLGENPTDVARGLKLTEQPHPPSVPAGLPSTLLDRRPDIQSAEQALIAANAQIGVAKAAYYPDISLTGEGGFQSDALVRLFGGPAGLWSYGAQLAQPIFTGGRIRSNVRLTEAQEQQALLTYQQTIQSAFQDVSDALIAYRKNREFREQQELLTEATRGADELSKTRYEGGVASYLEVLTSETNYFGAQLTLAQARSDELTAYVTLYNALGGGWQQ
jgi:multidrug efflux system outer membrane protein